MQKPVTVIVKVSATDFVKYRNVTDFQSLYRFLDKTFPGWRFGNVFNLEGNQIGSFTKWKRLTHFS